MGLRHLLPEVTTGSARSAIVLSLCIILPFGPAVSQEMKSPHHGQTLDWSQSWPRALVYGIRHDSDDGTELGEVWYPCGYANGLDHFGRAAVDAFTVGLRFAVPGLEQGQEVKYARLRLAAQGGDVTSGAHLVIRGVDEDSPETFSDVRRPSVLPKSDAAATWEIGTAWESLGSAAGLYYSSPNVADIINEIISRPSWGQGVEGRVLILTIEADGCPEGEPNYLRFEDYTVDPTLRDEARLEIYHTLASAFLGKPMLGRPTDTSVTMNMISLLNLDIYAEYGSQSGVYPYSTAPLLNQPAQEPIEIVIAGLEPDSTYHYRIRYREPGDSTYLAGMESRFHTQRAPGASYVFTIQADSHLWPLECRSDTAGLALYKQTIRNIGHDEPDFHVSMGDLSFVEHYHERDICTMQEAIERYLDQRAYLDTVTHSAPFFLVLGNHEAEQGWRVADPADSVAVWGALARKQVIPNPAPDRFYRGDETIAEGCGVRENYYAWEWGDALFVVLDPFWYTLVKPHHNGGEGSENPWDWTLGEDQYNWLYDTLHGSDAKWKFVMIHHLVGGVRSLCGTFWTPYGRGGIEAAKHWVDNRGSYEWGGENVWGLYTFPIRRYGWAHGPIHDMMVNAGVTFVFHGHDHVFVHQELDGVIYQECPQPVDATYGDGWYANAHYRLGTKLNNSGHLRVTVRPDYVQVDYVRSVLPKDEPLLEDGNLIYNGQVSYSYAVGIAGMTESAPGAGRPCLLGNRPNPFGRETRIRLHLPGQNIVSLKIYDIKGQLVSALLEGALEEGTHDITWDVLSGGGRPVAPGVYFSRLEAGETVDTRKMLLLR